jgi:hypothetical protein
MDDYTYSAIHTLTDGFEAMEWADDTTVVECVLELRWFALNSGRGLFAAWADLLRTEARAANVI